MTMVPFHAQLKKLTEELTGYEGIYECDNFKAKDSIGDMMVVLTHIAAHRIRHDRVLRPRL